ncbi:MAG: hypothetical protein H6Q00_2813 [Holophagaceae bacterium]|nr:hypothetical protein [Holophagaceae bacterium]
MVAGSRSILYARLCFRLALQREQSALDLLGLKDIQSQERAQGVAQSTRTYAGRFDAPGFPVFYAAEETRTCEAEVAHHLRVHYLRHKALRPQTFTYRLLQVPLSGRFDDLREPSLAGLQNPTRHAYPVGRSYAYAAFKAGMDGLIYASSRHKGGTCIARFLVGGLRLPVQELGTRSFRWNGKRLARATF